MISPDPNEASEQARFVLEMCAVGALNVVASVAVLFLRWRTTWWVLVALQVAVFAGAVIEGVRSGDPEGWFAFSFLPLLTVSALVAARFVPARLSSTARVPAA